MLGVHIKFSVVKKTLFLRRTVTRKLIHKMLYFSQYTPFTSHNIIPKPFFPDQFLLDSSHNWFCSPVPNLAGHVSSILSAHKRHCCHQSVTDDPLFICLRNMSFYKGLLHANLFIKCLFPEVVATPKEWHLSFGSRDLHAHNVYKMSWGPSICPVV